MFISNKVFFLEKKFFWKETDAIKFKLDEVRQVEESIQTSENIELDLIRSNPEPIIDVSLRRFSKVSCQLDRYYSFLIQNDDPIKLDENNEDPIIYMNAIQRSDSDKWLEAMKSEMESIKINDIWTLIDPSEEIKFIECK